MLEKVITEQLDFRDRKHWEEVDYIHENIEGCMDPMNYYD